MAAAYLSVKHPALVIDLVESSEIPTISVGESTNPIIRVFHDTLGLSEREFMRASNATYKIAIKFEHFSRLGHSFYHPFDKPFDRDIRFKLQADSYYLASSMCNDNKFERKLFRSYGYQLDASLYAQYLKNYSINRGVNHRSETITNVTCNSDGQIERVGAYEADLYVDCSGFRSLLLGQALKQEFISIEGLLLNDSAVAMNVPYVNPYEEIRPYTNCTALSAGWVWDIPLWNRRGTGYVYSSRFLTQAEAEEEFRGYLGTAKVMSLPCRHISIRNGRYRVPWVKNCVGIGLAAGFIEPLESTGLALAQRNIMDLSGCLDNSEVYNKRANTLFDTTVDFIMAHYVLSSREDTEYWKYIKYDSQVTESLSAVLSAARNNDYGPVALNADAFYRPMNWNAILSGMEFFTQQKYGDAPSADVRLRLQHYEYLKRYVYEQEMHIDN